ncbi:hypothetical protein SAMN05216323_102825 [Williamwhitmania taraxaci]|uniref:Uncharacterized protein n=1 Tax=Williamwhitmania taraxaci TaxID=1640674 RepID=A0A1G6L2V9_9BACT|nr:hypothetical protein SAMN05216323_102825 [Williamwhitmania taraxaci]
MFNCYFSEMQPIKSQCYKQAQNHVIAYYKARTTLEMQKSRPSCDDRDSVGPVGIESRDSSPEVLPSEARLEPRGFPRSGTNSPLIIPLNFVGRLIAQCRPCSYVPLSPFPVYTLLTLFQIAPNKPAAMVYLEKSSVLFLHYDALLALQYLEYYQYNNFHPF